MENKNELIITPKTKILQLIETYTQLEEVLIEYAPAFKKLKNPILRKTIARITTLQQAAAIGNVKVEDMINRLRKEVGQDKVTDSTTAGYNYSKPEWFSEDLIETEFSAVEMLARGEHPVNLVMADLSIMDEGKIYKLIAPFLPAPLIDKASSLNCQHWIDKKS
ncbi:MAG: DUF1858 domain-containing protein, partial [Bacteroidales bacterium]|nr:DUF1858 domain-containing protein [Bacteroidales bacterium]